MKTKDLNSLANLWNKTKNPIYKDLWYKEIKEMYGSNTSKRRTISPSVCHKRNDGWRKATQ